MTRLPRRTALAGLLLAPTACSLLPAGGTPPKLYSLTPAGDFPPGARVTWQLLVEPPVSPGALDTERIALRRSPISIDYFADAAWVDRAPSMLQSLLVQSFENSGRISAVARESLSLRADYILLVEMRHFEADYGAGDPPTVLVQLGAKLIRMPERSIAAQQLVEGKAQAAANQMPAIIEAFNDAFHQAARQMVEWTLSAAHR